ncbi:sulfotransferase [uncultured Sphingomonas sp.]|uniref:sulfotransferase n=1 Tax=uncultured Sphingomonas sp. TaxID=158754 RepID=UPI0025F00A1F|nr:sulfotransferase [uncultured Sphingomonas sp.]
MDQVVIGVLCYVNRSGSTLLSRMINDLCHDVYVFPEVGFTVELFLAHKYGREITGTRLYNLISGDPRISAMGITKDTLSAICLRHSSKDPAALFVDLATAKMGRKPAGIVIKHEKLAYLLETIEAAIPQVRYFHVVRDPRAVANSMLNTPVPEKPGFNMARGSILYPARHWRHYIKRLADWGASHPVVEIRYEDLHKDSGKAACASIAATLGTRLRSTDSDMPLSSYQTAAIDQALHAKIHDGFDERRTSGWRNELTPRHIRLVEATCRADMESLGYPLMTNHNARASIALASLMHNGVMVHHATRSLLRHLRRRDGLHAVRIQAALLRSKAQLRPRRPSV